MGALTLRKLGPSRLKRAPKRRPATQSSGRLGSRHRESTNKANKRSLVSSSNQRWHLVTVIFNHSTLHGEAPFVWPLRPYQRFLCKCRISIKQFCSITLPLCLRLWVFLSFVLCDWLGHGKDVWDELSPLEIGL